MVGWETPKIEIEEFLVSAVVTGAQGPLVTLFAMSLVLGDVIGAFHESGDTFPSAAATGVQVAHSFVGNVVL